MRSDFPLRAAILSASLCNASAPMNRWSTPCFDGTCTFEVPANQTSMSGIVKISGHPHSISDLSEAAGWIVMDCNPEASVQDVRIVCANDDGGCAHLFHGGAEDTIVRLPKSCGKSPFARVSKCEISDDQHIPSHVSSRMMERDRSPSQVHTLTFDTDFGKIDTSRAGPVEFEFIGTSDPNVSPSLLLDRFASEKRELGFRDLSSSFKGLYSRQSASLTGNASATVTVASAVNVFNHSIPCTNGDDAVSVDVLVSTDASVSLAFVLVGTIAPPAITGGAFFTNTTADIGGTITLSTNIVGQFDTGRLTVDEVSFPDLSIGIPELFSIGVSLNVFTEAQADFDIDMHLGVGFAYHVGDLQLIFPHENRSQPGVTITPGDGDLQLSVSPGIASNAKATLHLIPSLNIGLTTAFEHEVSASVFLDLDTSTTLSLTLEDSATTDVSSGDTNTEVIICVELDGGLSINAGVEGTFFNLFNGSTRLSVASTDLQLFQKCFTPSDDGGSSPSSSSSSSPSSTNSHSSFSSSATKTGPMTSLFTLIMHALALIWLGILIAGVDAMPSTSFEGRASTGNASNGTTSNFTFACPGSSIKPVTPLIHQGLNSSDYKPLSL